MSRKEVAGDLWPGRSGLSRVLLEKILKYRVSKCSFSPIPLHWSTLNILRIRTYLSALEGNSSSRNTQASFISHAGPPRTWGCGCRPDLLAPQDPNYSSAGAICLEQNGCQQLVNICPARNRAMVTRTSCLRGKWQMINFECVRWETSTSLWSAFT